MKRKNITGAIALALSITLSACSGGETSDAGKDKEQKEEVVKDSSAKEQEEVVDKQVVEEEAVEEENSIHAKQINTKFPDIKDNRPDVDGPESEAWLYGVMSNPVDNLKASSTLAKSKESSYGVENLSDDDARTAWVEGKADYGIGEYIEFENRSPRYRIYNGYQKDKNSFYNNSRVKSFKVYLDNEYVGIIILNDQPGEQEMDFSKFKSDFSKVKLEIYQVYEGKKWKDVAITELFWNGG